MPDNETSEKGLGSTGLERLIGRIKAYVIPDGTTIERKQDGTLGLKSGGIQSEFLSNGCVTTNKIASSAVTSDKLADGSVETSSIADGAVTPAKVSDLADLRGEMGLGDTLGALPVSCGGTGGVTAGAARDNLGIVPATNSQAGLANPDGETITAGQNGVISTTFPVPKLTYRGTVTATSNSITVKPPTGTSCTDFTLCVINCLTSSSYLSGRHDYYPMAIPVASATSRYTATAGNWMKVSVSSASVVVSASGSGNYGFDDDSIYAAFI